MRNGEEKITKTVSINFKGEKCSSETDEAWGVCVAHYAISSLSSASISFKCLFKIMKKKIRIHENNLMCSNRK